MKLYQPIKRETILDPKGRITTTPFVESFPLKRFFIVDQVPAGSVRGNHAHRTCLQILCCLRGEVSLSLDNGIEKQTLELNSTSDAILIPTLVWSSQKYKIPGSMILVLANEDYQESEYIRDYETFIKESKNK